MSCTEGDKLKAEYARYANTYLEYQRIHMMMAMIRANKIWQQHVDECAICKELADETSSQD